MTVYYFHFRDSAGELRLDEIGSHFTSDEEALLEAEESASELTSGSGHPWRGCRFEIRDERGWLVARVPIQSYRTARIVTRAMSIRPMEEYNQTGWRSH